MAMVRLIIAALLLLSLWATGFSQEQPAVNCATIEQCRILVLVARGQLLSAQDSWAFWADKAQKTQEQLEKLKKELQEKKQENENAESK